MKGILEEIIKKIPYTKQWLGRKQTFGKNEKKNWNLYE